VRYGKGFKKKWLVQKEWGGCTSQ